MFPSKKVTHRSNPQPKMFGGGGRIGGGLALLVLGAIGVWLGFHSHGPGRAVDLMGGFFLAFVAGGSLAIEVLFLLATKAVKPAALHRKE